MCLRFSLPFSGKEQRSQTSHTKMTTASWLPRWSVRDLASCFSPIRFPIDDHRKTPTSHVAVKNMAFDKRHKESFNKNAGPSKKCNNKRQLKDPIIKDKDVGASSGNRLDDSTWSLFVEDDYIVFCFGEEGAPDAVKDDKGVKSETHTKIFQGMHKNSRPVNSKVKYVGEDEEQVSEMKFDEIRSNANQHNIYEEEVQCDTPCISLREEEQKGHGILSSESRDSEGSRVSFAFPVLVWDWIGSPVQMPKSQGFHMRKQRPLDIRFQCCRF